MGEKFAELSKQEIGKIGEALALEHAVQKGYTIAGTNVRTPYGEIDLVLQKGNRISFIEVKTRSSFKFGFPEEAVDQRKLSHMEQSAEHYITEHELNESWQLDVISILLDLKSLHAKDIQWIENVAPNE